MRRAKLADFIAQMRNTSDPHCTLRATLMYFIISIRAMRCCCSRRIKRDISTRYDSGKYKRNGFIARTPKTRSTSTSRTKLRVAESASSGSASFSDNGLDRGDSLVARSLVIQFACETIGERATRESTMNRYANTSSERHASGQYAGCVFLLQTRRAFPFRPASKQARASISSSEARSITTRWQT